MTPVDRVAQLTCGWHTESARRRDRSTRVIASTLGWIGTARYGERLGSVEQSVTNPAGDTAGKGFWWCLDIRGNEALAQLTRLRVMAQVAAKLGWQPVNELLRLEGFEEPWECAMHKGVELPSDSTLAACGITGDAMIVTVRKVLVAEGACPPQLPPPLV